MLFRSLTVGFDPSAIAQWKRRGGLPRPAVTVQLADFFNVRVDDLVDDSKELPQITWERLRSVVEEAALPWPNDKKAQDIAGNAALDAHSPLHAQNLKTVRQLRAWAKECSDLADQIENLSTAKTQLHKKTP